MVDVKELCDVICFDVKRLFDVKNIKRLFEVKNIFDIKNAINKY